MNLLFNGISTFSGYLMPNPSFFERQLCYFLTHSWECICLNVNIMVQLKFELANFNSTVQNFNHYTPSSEEAWNIFHTLSEDFLFLFLVMRLTWDEETRTQIHSSLFFHLSVWEWEILAKNSQGNVNILFFSLFNYQTGWKQITFKKLRWCIFIHFFFFFCLHLAAFYHFIIDWHILQSGFVNKQQSTMKTFPVMGLN